MIAATATWRRKRAANRNDPGPSGPGSLLCCRTLFGGDVALHVRMDLADERVGTRGEGRDLVGHLLVRDDLALEHFRARRVGDLDVVRRALLIVEDDLERGVGRRADLGRVEPEVLRGDDDGVRV